MSAARRLAFRVFWLLLAAMLAGFFLFVRSLELRESVLENNAEGIVVLTGGADRISDALRLLEAQRGRRLLISGVNVNAPLDVLKKRWAGHDGVFDCCVDLDFNALNTHGNAMQARRWVRQHGFRSLVLVTAAYHMPRARLEFEAMMPGIAIHAYPVVPETSRIGRWWQDPALIRIIALEYVKYVYAGLRIWLRLPGG